MDDFELSDFESGRTSREMHKEIHEAQAVHKWDAEQREADPFAALFAAAARPEPETYQYQVFDNQRSRVVMDVPDEDADEIAEQVNGPNTPEHWVLRRRVVGPWEEVN